jgi:hypothetical protein
MKPRRIYFIPVMVRERDLGIPYGLIEAIIPEPLLGRAIDN